VARRPSAALKAAALHLNLWSVAGRNRLRRAGLSLRLEGG
jgi:hypothetical protein